LDVKWVSISRLTRAHPGEVAAREAFLQKIQQHAPEARTIAISVANQKNDAWEVNVELAAKPIPPMVAPRNIPNATSRDCLSSLTDPYCNNSNLSLVSGKARSSG
jgi:hypothetical protein